MQLKRISIEFEVTVADDPCNSVDGLFLYRHQSIEDQPGLIGVWFIYRLKVNND